MLLKEIILQINWVDVLVLILLFRISYVGFYKGLASELIPAIGTYAALIIALHYYSRMAIYIADHTPLNEGYSRLICYLLLILIVKFLIFNVIESFLIGRIVEIHVVSLVDKIGGLILGIIRGALLVSLIIIALEITPIVYITDSVNVRSLTAGKFSQAGRLVYYKTAAFLKMR